MKRNDRRNSSYPSGFKPDIGPRSSVRRRRVLVADDMPEIRHLISRFLQRHGYRVSTAQDGRGAWLMFQQTPYDVVITDLKMPVMDGAALTARIKTMAPETPVVIITGQAREAAREMADINSTAAAVLMKPFDFDTLLRTVATLVESEASAAAITVTV
jgi:CheY-like chemotaxis protein